MEETGLQGHSTRMGCWHNALDPASNYHYLIAFVVCQVDAEPNNLEPEKCDGWAWVPWASADFPFSPEQLFVGLRNIRAAGFSPFDPPLPGSSLI